MHVTMGILNPDVGNLLEIKSEFSCKIINCTKAN